MNNDSTNSEEKIKSRNKSFACQIEDNGKSSCVYLFVRLIQGDVFVLYLPKKKISFSNKCLDEETLAK